jgi:PAS domain S-box-containing protein
VAGAATAATTATTSILESISDGVFTVDRDWQVSSFNRAAEEITGIPRAEAIGRPCADVFRSSMCEARCALRQTLASGRPIIGRAGFIIDADGRRIPISVSTAVLRDADGRIVGGAETFRDLSEVEELRRELSGRTRVGDLVSRSECMQRVFDLVPAVAASASTLLVQGETGTGKELLARAVHDLSPRRKRPFVAVNCGAFPDTLLESELFGYKAGSFTGAVRDKPGRFARADGGTLFLDEIGEVSPALQVRLLRFLQERTFEPLGATRSERADVRVIAATHRDLAAMVKSGTFRDDLYYRINVIRVVIPPLRERKEDVPLLVEHFVERFDRLQQRRVPGVSAGALALLMAHEWPGNVRELENVIERAFVLCGDERIAVEHLPEELTARRRPRAPAGAGAGAEAGDFRATRRRSEAEAIEEALERCDGNRLAAARALGIHKSTLFRKLKALGIAAPERDGRTRG